MIVYIGEDTLFGNTSSDSNSTVDEKSVFDNVPYHTPFPILSCSLYLWMIVTGKSRWLRPFFNFHVLMYIVILKVPSSYIAHASDIEIIRFPASFHSFYTMKIVPTVISAWTWVNAVFLYAGDSDYMRFLGCYTFKKKFLYLAPLVTLLAKLILYFEYLFIETENHTIRLNPVDLFQFFLTVITLFVWFFWWIIIKKRANLSGFKIGYLINSVFNIILLVVVTILDTLNNMPSERETIIIHLYIASLCYLPFTWILAVFLSRQSFVQQVFLRKQKEEYESFQLSYISF